MFNSMQSRDYNSADQVVLILDRALQTLFGKPSRTERPDPTTAVEDRELSAGERQLSGRLMRINHTGEVCAQALYQGQALTARQSKVKEKLEHSAAEENDHLCWCEQRLDELGVHKSVLNPAFYLGSFLMGAGAGLLGDRWNLGFLAETEKQVVKHIDVHLDHISKLDKKSIAILNQMREDEGQHATVALHSGGMELPEPVKKLMQQASKVMTKTTYWF